MHIIYKSTICLQMPLCDAFNSGFKRWALDRRVDGEKRVQQYLDICLPEIYEECADAVVVLDVVQEDKLDSSGDKGGDGPLVVPVDAPEIECACGLHGLFDAVEAHVGDHLAEGPVALGGGLGLEEGAGGGGGGARARRR